MAVINGTTGADSRTGGVEDDTINGLAGNDTLDGGGGIDALFGGADNDLLWVRTDDTADAGTGDDIVAIAGDQTGSLEGGTGTDILRFDGAYDLTGVALSGFEQLNAYGNGILTASQLNGFLIVSGYNDATTTAALALSEGGVANITLSATLTVSFTLTGSAEQDKLTFDPGYTHAIFVYAGGGNDSITSAAGGDSLRGEDGNDTLTGFDGNDSLDGGNGTDQLFGGTGNDVLITGATDRASGGAGDDLFSLIDNNATTLAGGGNTDVLRFEGGYDISGTVITDVEQILLYGVDSMTAAQLGSFQLVAGYNAATTSATVILTQGGTASVALAATLSGTFSLTGSGQADILTFAPTYLGSISAYFGSGNDDVTSGGGGDNLRGEAGDDTIYGMGGFDTLDGGFGVDALYGGISDDVLIAREGDRIFGDAGNDLLSVQDNFVATLAGGQNQDILRFETSYDITGAVISGIEQVNLNGNDSMTASQLDMFTRVSGYSDAYTTGALTLTEGGTADVTLNTTLTGGFSLQGSFQADLITFAAAYSHGITAYAGSGNDSITAASGSDSLRGDNGNDTLNGGSGDDSIDGGNGADSLYGGAGNDVLYVRNGDGIYGGADDDLLSVQSNGAGVVDGGGGDDILRFESSYDISGTVLSGIEQVNLTGNAAMTTAQLASFALIAGYGVANNSATLYLTQGGTASVSLATSLSLSFSLYGSTETEAITFAPAGTQQLFVYAGAGDDFISAAGGADSLRGDTGDDTLLGLVGNDTIDGGLGVDSLDGGAGNDALIVRAFDRAYGGGNDDLFSIVEGLPAVLSGGSGTDTLRTENAFDISTATLTGIENLNAYGLVSMTAAQLDSFALVQGYAANYTSATVKLTTGGMADVKLAATLAVSFAVTGSAQADTLTFNGSYVGSIQINAGFGNDDLTGASGSDILRGDQGNDTLIGQGGNDTLEGGSGADLLNSGAGTDVLTGGSGRDVFEFGTVVSSSPVTPDRITDFEAAGVGLGDLIDLSGIDADGTFGALDAFVFGSTGRGGLSIVDSGTDTLIRLNIDNSAAFEIIILIADGAVVASAYTAADFIL